MYSTVLHNKIKPFNICVHILQLDYTYIFCSFNCLKNDKCKNPQMEILQKNPYFIFCMATVTLPQQYSTLSLFPGSSS